MMLGLSLAIFRGQSSGGEAEEYPAGDGDYWTIGINQFITVGLDNYVVGTLRRYPYTAADGAPPAGITYARTGTAWGWNDAGGLVAYSANQCRIARDPDTGDAIGFYLEDQRTNLIADPRGFSGWTASNVTVTGGQAGIDGTTGASKIGATAGNATISKAHTLAEAEYTFTAWVTRVEPVDWTERTYGDFSVSMDGGTTWTLFSGITLIPGKHRIRVTQTLANPTIVFKIETAGDEFIIDCKQLEAAPFPSSEILTGGATRNADVFTTPNCGELSVASITAQNAHWPLNEETIIAEFVEREVSYGVFDLEISIPAHAIPLGGLGWANGNFTYLQEGA
jgi:hypothetical protein